MTTERKPVPDGYRLLTVGEVIKSGDIYTRGGESSWHPTNHTGGRWNPNGYWPMARPVQKPKAKPNVSSVPAEGETP